MLAPLDPRAVDELLAQHRDLGTTDMIAGTRVERRGGCVRTVWYRPSPDMRSIRFVLELQAATGCTIADIEHGRLISPAELLATLL